MAIEITKTLSPELTAPQKFKPFGDIAITLSGGGFRSSTYSLGCLSYLNHRKYDGKTLLERVKFVASASGGTMTAILFSAHNHLGIPFEKTFDVLYNHILSGDKILKEAARIINDDKEWEQTPFKSRNLINSFAKAYQKVAFNNMDFGVYWDGSKASVEVVCFNASELENGRTFRFQTDGKRDCSEVIGNFYLRIVDDNLPCIRKIKLGDIMAASSCFPAGFEPMVFPDDFAESEEHLKELLLNTEIAKDHDWAEYEPMNRSFELVDGGITDNQAIESMKLASERWKRRYGRGFDLVLICDVSNYFMPPLEPVKEEVTWWNFISIKNILNLHRFALVPFFVSIVMLATGTFPGLAWVTATVSAIMFMLYLFFRYEIPWQPEEEDHPAWRFRKAKPKKHREEMLWSLPVKVFIDFVLGSPIKRTAYMLKMRVHSALRVSTLVYLMQIRRINYESLYESPEWEYKTKGVGIYELSKSNENVLHRQFGRKKLSNEAVEQLSPTEKMMDMAEYARLMGNTLWFPPRDAEDERDMKDSLVATGQFTMCFNLIEYIYQLENKFAEVKTDPEIQQLKEELISDWKRFKHNPMFLLEELSKKK